jgi:hypothetical protein
MTVDPTRMRQIPTLTCSKCGNKDVFVEIMDYEVHLVDGNLNYLHVLESQVDYYKCYVCDEPIDIDCSPNNP